MNLEMSCGTVFIVDDDAPVRRALQRIVRSAGWDVEVFGSGGAFVERLPYWGTGCLLLDVCMPGMSGLQLQQWMLDRAMTLPVIYLTGHSHLPLSRLQYRAVDVLFKPVDAQVLLDTIVRAIGHDPMSETR